MNQSSFLRYAMLSYDGGNTFTEVILYDYESFPVANGMSADTGLHGSGVRESEPLTRSGLGRPDAMESD